MTALATLHNLHPVSLEDLNAAAELQTRVDRKYLLTRRDLPAVLAQLPAGTEVLEVGGERLLRYASRYFDTPELDSYLGAAHGRRRRFKVRARTYVDSGGSFLEVKTRGGRSATVKDRVPVGDDGVRAGLDEAAVGYAAGMLAEAGIPHAEPIAQRLEPVLTTGYRRATLLLPGDDGDASRGTIDIDLRWRDLHAPDDTGTLTLPDAVIVETKSGCRAGALDRALWRCGHRPATVSKYATGLAALRPGLPRNKWHRTLQRHFSTPKGHA
ncbi:polyphosphate polymerase domain-containing protein [Microbacterium sp. Sa4CUA7]|uniref:Polyphosphate polymerase domain-containing protein n=1 Tax=Microbacterium pullorum TaxID=2762236 RepID=A0ABR8S5S0_9MICO|nr:polyphosphate polymerase domain-containing protein [Microbacterium pullorum]MBD7958807.1 polyphosphate polymerase domain-containing protein [Microbacterium pullorum]